MERDQKSFPTYTPRKLVKANKHVEETYIFIYFSTASFSAQLALACIYAIEKSAFEERFMGHPAFFLTATEDRFCSNAQRRVDQRDQTHYSPAAATAAPPPPPPPHTWLTLTKRFTNLKVNQKRPGLYIGAKMQLVFYQCIMTFWGMRGSKGPILMYQAHLVENQ